MGNELNQILNIIFLVPVPTGCFFVGDPDPSHLPKQGSESASFVPGSGSVFKGVWIRIGIFFIRFWIRIRLKLYGTGTGTDPQHCPCMELIFVLAIVPVYQ